MDRRVRTITTDHVHRELPFSWRLRIEETSYHLRMERAIIMVFMSPATAIYDSVRSSPTSRTRAGDGAVRLGTSSSNPHSRIPHREPGVLLVLQLLALIPSSCRPTWIVRLRFAILILKKRLWEIRQPPLGSRWAFRNDYFSWPSYHHHRPQQQSVSCVAKKLGAWGLPIPSWWSVSARPVGLDFRWLRRGAFMSSGGGDLLRGVM